MTSAVLTPSPQTSSTTALLTRLSTGTSAYCLVCLPHAGGAPAAYRYWTGVGRSAQVWAVNLPGRGRARHEPVAQAWQPLVQRIADEVAALPGRLVLLGHSMGALLAYEVARVLAAAGAEPSHLVVVGRGAPETAVCPNWPVEPDRFLDAVATRYGGVPDVVRAEPDVFADGLRVLRADLDLLRRYAWSIGPRLDCPITAVRGERDETASPAAVAGWRLHTRGDFRAETLPGGHFFDDGDRPALVDLIIERALR